MAKRKMSENSLKNLELGKKICEETARKYQKKSCVTQKENTQKRKEIESFSISANKALTPIQAKSLKDLANKAQAILDNPNSTQSEVKLAMEILTFLRDSSGQKPTDKQEITGNVGVQKVFIDSKTKEDANKVIDSIINDK